MVDDDFVVEPEGAYRDLRREYDSGQLVLFVGAGVSAAAGLPGWQRLAELALERVQEGGASEAIIDEIRVLMDRSDYVGALSAAKDNLGSTDFGSLIESVLNDETKDVPPVAEAIAVLGPKLRAVLTTNLDHLLERAFAGRWPPLYRGTGDLARQQKCIIKLHGTLRDRQTWVLTREEYDRALYRDSQPRTGLSALFQSCPILFVGYGMKDDDLDAILGRVRELAGTQPPRHFVVLPRREVGPYRRSLLQQSGITLLTYPNMDGRHLLLPELLTGLRGSSVPKISPGLNFSVAVRGAPAPSFRSYAATWLERKRLRASRSIPDYRSVLDVHLLPAFGDISLDEIGPDHIRIYLAQLRGGVFASRTIRNIYQLLRNILKSAQSEKIIDVNPCSLLNVQEVLPKSEDSDKEAHRRAYFERHEIVTLLSTEAIPLKIRATYAALALTGANIGEVAALRWNDVDLERKPLGSLRLGRVFNSKIGTTHSPSKLVEREVPIHPVLSHLLRLWRNESGAELNIVDIPPLVFPAARSEGASRNTVTLHRLHQDLESLGLEKRRVQDFRRTFKRLAHEDGIPPHIIHRFTHGRPLENQAFVVGKESWDELCAYMMRLQLPTAASTAA